MWTAAEARDWKDGPMTETSHESATPAGDRPRATPYAATVSLRWSDMDAYAHINNVQFLRLLEDARVIAFRDWFEGGGAGDRTTLLDEGVLVSRHEIEYRRPLGFRHEPVEIQLWVSRLGGAGFDVAYIVTDPEGVGEGERPVYAVAETELALYDFASASPRRIRPDERASVLAHVGGPAPFRRRRR
jgi:acyl-CoA thioester hydrolase